MYLNLYRLTKMITRWKKSHRNAQSHVENTLLRIFFTLFTMMMTSAEQCMSNENKIKWFKIKKKIEQFIKRKKKTWKHRKMRHSLLQVCFNYSFFFKRKRRDFCILFPFCTSLFAYTQHIVKTIFTSARFSDWIYIFFSYFIIWFAIDGRHIT